MSDTPSTVSRTPRATRSHGVDPNQRKRVHDWPSDEDDEVPTKTPSSVRISMGPKRSKSDAAVGKVRKKPIDTSDPQSSRSRAGPAKKSRVSRADQRPILPSNSTASTMNYSPSPPNPNVAAPKRATHRSVVSSSLRRTGRVSDALTRNGRSVYVDSSDESSLSAPSDDEQDHTTNRSTPAPSIGFGSSFTLPPPTSSQLSTASTSTLFHTASPTQYSNVTDYWNPGFIHPWQPVFVRLEPLKTPSISENGSVWWPATITRDGLQASVEFRRGVHNVQLPNTPSSDTVLPLRGSDGTTRFNSSNFRVNPSLAAQDPILDTQWIRAIQSIDIDQDYGDEGEVDAALANMSDRMSDTESVVQRRRWEEELFEEERQDAETNFPEKKRQYLRKIVLCKQRRTDTDYWPAGITDVTLARPQRRPKRYPENYFYRFTIMFFDGSSRPNVQFDSIVTMDDSSEFSNCQLGQILYWHPDDDSDSEDHPKGDEPTSLTNASALLPSAEFRPSSSLQLRLRHAFPVLLAIINDTYHPLLSSTPDGDAANPTPNSDPSLVDLFYAGGSARAALGHNQVFGRFGRTSGKMRGERDGDDALSEFTSDVVRLMLPDHDARVNGRQVVAEPVLQTEVPEAGSDGLMPDTSGLGLSSQTAAALLTESDEIARPKGSERYEALSRSERIGFCSDILASQAAIQLTVWHHKLRTTTELLSPEEEIALYVQGRTLALEEEASEIDVDHAESSQKSSGNGKTVEIEYFDNDEGGKVPLTKLYDFVSDARMSILASTGRMAFGSQYQSGLHSAMSSQRQGSMSDDEDEPKAGRITRNGRKY